MKLLSSVPTLFLLAASLGSCGTAPDSSTQAESAVGTAPDPAQGSSAAMAEASPAGEVAHVERSEAEWREQLGPQRFEILREKGTERAFTGEYWDEKTEGVYRCAGCDLALFDSSTKFKSGTGWPSFWEPIVDAHVAEDRDTTFGMTRTEILCAACDGHLGHVFPDGPKPTGLRYCVNSASLRLEPR